MAVTFISTNGFCPRYKEFYIMERPGGTDQYNNKKYEYALYKIIPVKEVKTFAKRKEAILYLSELTGFSTFSYKHGNTNIHYDKDRRVIACIANQGKTIYWLDLKTCKITSKPYENERITGWYESYNECLAFSKEYIEKMENKQISIFDIPKQLTNPISEPDEEPDDDIEL